MSALWRPAYVAIGSNLDDPRERVLEACERIGALARDSSRSALAPVLDSPHGSAGSAGFHQCRRRRVDAARARKVLLDALLDIERQMGRVRRERWGPRLIDLDLVWMVGAAVERAGAQRCPIPECRAATSCCILSSDIAPTLDIPGHGRVVDLKARSGRRGNFCC